MIEVNLLPGGRKRASRRFAFSLPKLGRGGEGGPDPYTMFFAAAAVVAIGYAGWAFYGPTSFLILPMGVQAEEEELGVRLDTEVSDSIRFAGLIEQTNRLTAQGDSIAERVAIIQEIDHGRYVWPHLLDEIGAAVPEYMWLSEVLYTADSPLQVRIVGSAGSIDRITRFMRRLEASRFLRDVEPQSMSAQPSEENPDDLVQVFDILVIYEPPPIDELEFVPLFEDDPVPSPTGN